MLDSNLLSSPRISPIELPVHPKPACKSSDARAKPRTSRQSHIYQPRRRAPTNDLEPNLAPTQVLFTSSQPIHDSAAETNRIRSADSYHRLFFRSSRKRLGPQIPSSPSREVSRREFERRRMVENGWRSVSDKPLYVLLWRCLSAVPARSQSVRGLSQELYVIDEDPKILSVCELLMRFIGRRVAKFKFSGASNLGFFVAFPKLLGQSPGRAASLNARLQAPSRVP